MDDEQIRELDSVLEKKLNNVPMFHPCIFQTVDYGSGYWLCSAQKLTKEESKEYVLKNRDRYTTNGSIKICMQVPSKVMMLVANANPFGSVLYDFENHSYDKL